MTENAENWSRLDAERQIRDVLERAKSGTEQLVIEHDGVFEVRFIPHRRKPGIGEVLARGGPERD